MSSTQQQKSVDLIEFSNNSDNMDVLDKPNSGVVQKMVMSGTASASLIATAVAKLTTSSVTTTAPSSVSVVNKSESATDSPSSNQKLDNVGSDTVINSTTTTTTTTTTIAAPLNEMIPLIPTQVCHEVFYITISLIYIWLNSS